MENLLEIGEIVTTKLYFRVQYKDEIEWLTIISPCNYKDIINEGKLILLTCLYYTQSVNLIPQN